MRARLAPALALALAVLPARDAAPRAAAANDLRSMGLAYATGWAHDENSGDGFSYFRATTVVDCANTRVGIRQSADIFTGAYAHAADGRVLSYADMGVLLENDALAPGELGRPDKAQLYGQASTDGATRLLRFDDAPGERAPQFAVNVACDSVLTLTFFVASANESDVRYDGTFVPKHGGARFAGRATARIVGFVPADGWSTACPRCAVRRVDTLAVGSGAPERPGSYFGIVDVRGGREPVERWTRTVAGRYAGGRPGDVRAYALRPFVASRRDVVDAPPGAAAFPPGRPAFLIRGEGTPDERIGLDERTASEQREAPRTPAPLTTKDRACGASESRACALPS